MAKLFLLRHLKSQWNEENRFTGWTDVPLAENQGKEIKKLAKKLSRFKIDAVYSSNLFRNMDTIAEILEYDKRYPIFIHLDSGKMKKWGNFRNLSKHDIPVYVTEKLNERYYGKLQGKNKKEEMKKYGREKVNLWRRGYKTAPPAGESLRDVFKRVLPFFLKYIKKDLTAGKNILVVASHNSLRALVKKIENISDEKIIKVEINYGELLEYDINSKGLPKNRFFDRVKL